MAVPELWALGGIGSHENSTPHFYCLFVGGGGSCNLCSPRLSLAAVSARIQRCAKARSRSAGIFTRPGSTRSAVASVSFLAGVGQWRLHCHQRCSCFRWHGCYDFAERQRCLSAVHFDSCADAGRHTDRGDGRWKCSAVTKMMPPNKSLQTTRDGRSSSASRFTSFGPACLSSGR